MFNTHTTLEELFQQADDIMSSALYAAADNEQAPVNCETQPVAYVVHTDSIDGVIRCYAVFDNAVAAVFAMYDGLGIVEIDDDGVDEATIDAHMQVMEEFLMNAKAAYVPVNVSHDVRNAPVYVNAM